MDVKLQTEQHLEFLRLKGGCTDWSESTHVKMPDCWKLHVMAHMFAKLAETACNNFVQIDLACCI